MQAPVIHIELDENDIPRTINRRVKVSMIALKHTYGEPAGAIAAHYGITLADVYAALAYYHDNRADFEDRERAAAPIIAEAERYTAELKAKIRERMRQQGDE